jgi:hypothetical protein
MAGIKQHIIWLLKRNKTIPPIQAISRLCNSISNTFSIANSNNSKAIKDDMKTIMNRSIAFLFI